MCELQLKAIRKFVRAIPFNSHACVKYNFYQHIVFQLDLFFQLARACEVRQFICIKYTTVILLSTRTRVRSTTKNLNLYKAVECLSTRTRVRSATKNTTINKRQNLSTRTHVRSETANHTRNIRFSLSTRTRVRSKIYFIHPYQYTRTLSTCTHVQSATGLFYQMHRHQSSFNSHACAKCDL